MQIKDNRQALKISESFITGMACPKNAKDYVVVSNSSGQIQYVKINPLMLMRTVRVFKQFATCLLPFEEGFLVGSQNGKIVYLNSKDKIVSESRIHNDSISSIIESDSFIITTSFDGQVIFMTKDTFNIVEKINLEIPIMKATFHDNSLYTASNPSYRINTITLEIKQIKRFDYFQEFNRKLYGCSDERGLSCVSTNSNSYIPCNYILPVKDRMLIFSDQCIGELIHTDHMQWKCHRIKEIKTGTTFIGGCIINQNIILGDEQGKIYKFEYQLKKRELSRKKHRNLSLN